MNDALVRNFEAGDVASWLQLRKAAMSTLVAAGRGWTEDDFAREFTDQPKFDSNRMWVVEPLDPKSAPKVVASIYVAIQPSDRTATVRWLLVHPDFQRRQIATHLLALAESAAWQSECRSIRLDTLSNWKAACAFYANAGYIAR